VEADMRRAEFSKPVKRAAWERSGQRCEAVGEKYGLGKDIRCNAPLVVVEYDHLDLDANSKDNSLDNCRAVCPACHAYKTRTHDIPKAAKTVRQQDKARGIEKEKQKIQSRPFAKKERAEKPALPPRRLFR
jgi:hypothetical protein